MEVLPEEEDVGQDRRVDAPQKLDAEVAIPAEVGQRVVVEDMEKGVNMEFPFFSWWSDYI